ncbi:MAG: SGNH/GDSL hydrolase family protein [Bacteroidia bacterium]
MSRIFTIACTLFPALISFLLSGCKPELVGPKPSAGNLNINRYIAIGDGFTAGATNSSLEPGSFNGLYEDGQRYAFPRLIADQFSMVHTIPFEQPVIAGNGSGFLRIESIAPTTCPADSPDPILSLINSENGWKTPYSAPKLLNNLGIHQLKASQVLPDSAVFANPFFTRISPVGSSYLSLIKDSRPGFFTLWLGTTDFLNFAMKGAAYPGAGPADSGDFASAFSELLGQITADNPEAKGVIGNIPDVTLFPYFRHVKHVYINREKCKGSVFPIYISTNTGIRIATESDCILLPAKDKIGTDYGGGISFGLGPQNPIPNHWVLDEAEVIAVRNQIGEYNALIREKINALNETRETPAFAVADINYLIGQLDRGYKEDGLEISTDYLSGGIFSLDGIYFTPRGNAVIANTFIRTINIFSSFEASIPPINITDFSGVIFP